MTDLDNFVKSLNRKIDSNKKSLLFICIGTNDVIWDSIGPLTGTYLKKNIGNNMVLGDTKANIRNIQDILLFYPNIRNKFIIAIDAAISPKELEGEIFITNKPLVMGLGVNNNKGIIGDISIKVALCEKEKITKEYVNNRARFIAKGITRAVS